MFVGNFAERGLSIMRKAEKIPEVNYMTLVQQATNMMEKLPIRSQQVVVDLLKMLSGHSETAVSQDTRETRFFSAVHPYGKL